MNARFAIGFIVNVLVLWHSMSFADEVIIPACTGYSEPSIEGASFTEKRGITRWNTENTLSWYGHFDEQGKVHVAFNIKLPKGEQRSLILQHDQQSIPFSIASSDDQLQRIEVGDVDIDRVGYHAISLIVDPAKTEKRERDNRLVLDSLVLSGVPVAKSHFNLKERRNAASVHLSFPVDRNQSVAWFYNEVTAIEDPIYTFYMACGFSRGYFGMQVNAPDERRIIFSVWDSGKGASANQRTEVDKKDYVSVLAKGADVHTNDFGGEGTGGHSHLVYAWKTGDKQRFLVTAQPSEDKSTIYTGYYFHPDDQKWMLIASMRAPDDGGYLRGLHGFSENFVGSNGNLQRKALFGNQWIRTSDDRWIELTSARFTHDETGKADRLDRFMGVEKGQFFLSHGGFVEGFTQMGQTFDRPSNPTTPPISRDELR